MPAQVLIPSAIQQVLRPANPSQKNFRAPPKPPQTAPTAIAVKKILIEVLILVLMGSLALINPILGIVTLVLGGAIIVLQVRIQLTSYPHRDREYQAKLATYLTALETYGKAEARQGKAVNKSRRENLAIALQKYKFNYGVDYEIEDAIAAPQSISEFAQHLQAVFGEKIQLKIQVPILGLVEPFLFDFAYIDAELNLHIGMAIDQVIQDPDLEAQGQWTKQTCEQFLIQSGWILVNFSQTQVQQSPQSCGKVLAQLLAQLLDAPEFCLTYAQVADLA